MKKFLMLFLLISAIYSNRIIASDPDEKSIPTSMARSFCNFVDDGSLPRVYLDPQIGSLGAVLRLVLPHGTGSSGSIFTTHYGDMRVDIFIKYGTGSRQTKHEFRMQNPDTAQLASFHDDCRKAIAGRLPLATE